METNLPSRYACADDDMPNGGHSRVETLPASTVPAVRAFAHKRASVSTDDDARALALDVIDVYDACDQHTRCALLVAGFAVRAV